MPPVQTRLDLPTRKPGSRGTGKRDETPPTTPRTRTKLIAAMDEPERMLRTPRRGRTEKTPNSKIPGPSELRTPGKRRGDDDQDETGVSPTKLHKQCDNTKENSVPSLNSPSVHLQKLSLNSPRAPLSARKEPLVNAAKRVNLFSPRKHLSAQNIEDMLSPSDKWEEKDIVVDEDISFKSPMKSQSRLPVKSSRPQTLQVSPTKRRPSPAKGRPSPAKGRPSPAKVRPSPMKGLSASAVENLLCSPVKSPRPASKSERRSIQISPVKDIFKRPSPLKISSFSELEDLLCSPVKQTLPAKSPVKSQLAAKSPGKSLLPVRSPRKPATPVKSPRKGAANLFSSPRKENTPANPPVTPTTIFKADVTQVQI